MDSDRYHAIRLYQARGFALVAHKVIRDSRFGFHEHDDPPLRHSSIAGTPSRVAQRRLVRKDSPFRLSWLIERRYIRWYFALIDTRNAGGLRSIGYSNATLQQVLPEDHDAIPLPINLYQVVRIEVIDDQQLRSFGNDYQAFVWVSDASTLHWAIETIAFSNHFRQLGMYRARDWITQEARIQADPRAGSGFDRSFQREARGPNVRASTLISAMASFPASACVLVSRD